MSRNTFSLLLTGLCEFVPRYPIDEEEYWGKNRMRVLLVDSSKPPAIPHYHQGTFEPHLPVLVCPWDAVDRDSSERCEDVSFYEVPYQEGPAELMAIFYLDDQDLCALVGHTTGYNLTVTYNEPGNGCPKSESPDSFAWVAPIETISPGSGDVRKECFGDAKVDRSVIARLLLSEGTVGTGRMALDGDGDTAKWRFRVPAESSRSSKHVQALADVIKWEVDFDGDSISLKTKLFRKTKNRRVEAVFERGSEKSIVLKADKIPAGKVWLKNMPWADIAGTRPKPKRGRREADVHFAHFYDLSITAKAMNVPHQYGKCLYKDPRHQGNPFCQPAQGKANPYV